MRFKHTFTCDVCGEEITYPNFMIECGFNNIPFPKNRTSFEFIHVCHNRCSYGLFCGIDRPCAAIQQIFSQSHYTPDYINGYLNNMAYTNPSLASKIAQIKNKIFE